MPAQRPAQLIEFFKIALVAAEQTEPIRTKVEFSRRDGDPRFELKVVPAAIVAPYALRAPSLQHYTGESTVEQKIEALAGRSETQARDVFDLDLLLRRRPPYSVTATPAVCEVAASRALELPYDAFRDQVLPFLDVEVAELFVGEGAWQQIQGYVVERLLAPR